MEPFTWPLRQAGYGLSNRKTNEPMKKALSWVAEPLLLIMLAMGARAADSVCSAWVYPGPDGKLVYKTTPVGDKIMDFSHAGYMGGGVALPQVPVKRTLQPSGTNDQTAAIQKALDEVGAMKPENGFRGAVLLAPGVFPCSATLNISSSGVVLRGSGSGAPPGSQTTLKMTGAPHVAINLRAPAQAGRSNARARNDERGAAQTFIADPYVPSGAVSFHVADPSGFATGDPIEIRRPVTEAWVRFMQMDDLVRDGRPQTWIRPGTTITVERRVASISGKTITLDVPLADSFDSNYLKPPGVSVVKAGPSLRLSQAGVEDLLIESPPQPINHTQPH